MRLAEPRGAHRRGVEARCVVGAKPVGPDRLEGENVMGCLLEELRDGPSRQGPAFRLGAYEVRRVGWEIEQRRVLG